MMTRLREVWYGQRSLAETYWGWGCIAYVISLLLLVALGGIGAVTGKPLLMIVLFLVLSIPISVFQIVANWRSSGNHPGFWANVVRVLVVIGIIVMIIQFASLFFTNMSSPDLQPSSAR